MTDIERPAQAARYRSVSPSREARYRRVDEARCSVLYSLVESREVRWLSHNNPCIGHELISGNGVSGVPGRFRRLARQALGRTIAERSK